MDNRQDVREFLTSRRGRLTPAQAGIVGGGRRRVPGLRREEVAFLAGVSVDYYVRMERGDLAGVSPEILDALATALQLTDAETDHLHALARAAGPAAVRRRPSRPSTSMRPSLQRILDAITDAPAWIVTPRKDLVALNALGRTLHAPLLEDPEARGNTARFVFLSAASRTFYPAWERSADSIVASLRLTAGQNPRDTHLTDLIGELVTRSEEFRQRWSAHDVRYHRAGVKRMLHPQVGELELTFDGLELPGTPGWMMFVCTAEPGSPSEERLRLLASLAASQKPIAPMTMPVKPREE
ncbi:transcriptional regulator [Brachybacterium ginsengisoli]|uniref:Transcriptional regulator n=1 Tax=Brachybacterium ginsengisoli TaxID=1331682 RepID=A0A291GU12_9MICO|nr:helix-turn-helix transcriptional regulator [Brachybacterium ginsengisoli]ATG53687.1 transcriptional regulator [Brachybacterium ginsengisoli]